MFSRTHSLRYNSILYENLKRWSMHYEKTRYIAEITTSAPTDLKKKNGQFVHKTFIQLQRKNPLQQKIQNYNPNHQTTNRSPLCPHPSLNAQLEAENIIIVVDISRINGNIRHINHICQLVSTCSARILRALRHVSSAGLRLSDYAALKISRLPKQK